MAEYFYKLCPILIGLQGESNYKQIKAKQTEGQFAKILVLYLGQITV